MCESSTVAVCHSSVTAVVCEICDFIKFYAVLELFEANSGLNNQEVKRSLNRLQNVNNLPKYYIHTCLTCRSLAELSNFISLDEL